MRVSLVLESILPGKKCPDVGIHSLQYGESFPADPLEQLSEEDVVGPALGQIHRENQDEMNK